MKGWVTIAFALCVLSVFSSAQTQMPWYVVSSGGYVGAVSGTRVLSGTIGQVIVGNAGLTPGDSLYQGFWLPLNTTTGVDEEWTVDLSGSVTNFPNPFSTSTTIRFGTPVEGTLTVRVFDLVGNLVRTLQAEMSLSGAQDIPFDGLSSSGAPLGDGTYLYEVSGRGIDGNRFRSVQRMTILR